ncbi:acyltransferase [Magnetospirillum sp. 15-1]|uniref:acyltransferase n=1 Tax=Magnetospirillum sp. 15-1 TaxID=1979370 RepID=UPI001F5B1F49|nr:acyltransferase [Magnetospirillum sp. 15-1]
MSGKDKTVAQMSRSELMELLKRFAGVAPPQGYDQDDWDDWLVASVLQRCRRDAGDESIDGAGTANAIKLLAPLKFFPQLLPHLEHQLGRGLTAQELEPAVALRKKK